MLYYCLCYQNYHSNYLLIYYHKCLCIVCIFCNLLNVPKGQYKCLKQNKHVVQRKTCSGTSGEGHAGRALLLISGMVLTTEAAKPCNIMTPRHSYDTPTQILMKLSWVSNSKTQGAYHIENDANNRK